LAEVTRTLDERSEKQKLAIATKLAEVTRTLDERKLADLREVRRRLRQPGKLPESGTSNGKGRVKAEHCNRERTSKCHGRANGFAFKMD